MEEALLLMNDAKVIHYEELFLLQEENRPYNLHIGFALRWIGVSYKNEEVLVEVLNFSSLL